MNYKKRKKKPSCSVSCKPSKRRPKKHYSEPKIKRIKGVEIVKNIPGGKGLAFHNEKPVFVDRALEGEVVEVALTKANSKGYFGYAFQIEKESSQRITPRCEYYEKCGGCNLQHISYDDQLILKEKFLIDQFSRIAKYNLDNVEVVPSEEWGYRSRARVQVKNKKWGFLQRDSHKMIEVSSCPILDKGIEEALNTQIDLSKIEEKDLHLQVGDHGVVWGDAKTRVEILGKTFPIRAGAFFQSNQILLDDLVKDVLNVEFKEKKLAMDLFAGIGFFSAFLSDHFDEVVAVERDVKCKKTALAYLPQNVLYFCDSVEDYIDKEEGGLPDFLVVDPPRLGLSKEVKSFLLKLKTPKICYVSCEASTLARDVKDLLDGGYKIDSVKGFDLYPQTSHIETVVHLSL